MKKLLESIKANQERILREIIESRRLIVSKKSKEAYEKLFVLQTEFEENIDILNKGLIVKNKKGKIH